MSTKRVIIGVALVAFFGIALTIGLARAGGDIAWLLRYDDGRRIALEEKLPLLIYIEKPGDADCDRMLATTFNDRAVAVLLDRFVLCRIDVMKQSDELDRIVADTKIDFVKAPDVRLMRPDGSLLAARAGFVAAGPFCEMLRTALETLEKESEAPPVH